MECKCLEKDKLLLTNGCGSSYWLAWIFRIPRWFSGEFWCICNYHDIFYQEGETIEHKQYADDLLYDSMYYSAYKDPNILRKRVKILIADIAYWCLSTKLSEQCFISAKPKKFYFN